MNKILIIGDLHGEIEPLTSLARLFSEEKFEAVVLVGDIGPNTLYDFSNCSKTNKDIYLIAIESVFRICLLMAEKVFFVPGNWDLSNLPSNPYSNVYNVDLLNFGEKQILLDRYIIGIGGSNYLNGLFPYEWDNIAEKKLYEFSSSMHFEKPVILITHSPPYGNKIDHNFQNKPQGSRLINPIIEKISPTITFCGHIHEASGVDIISPGKPIINAGIFSKIDLVEKINMFDHIKTVTSKIVNAFIVKIINDDDIEIQILTLIGSAIEVTTIKYSNGKLYKLNDSIYSELETTFSQNKHNLNT